jgi:hypothetical protein
MIAHQDQTTEPKDVSGPISHVTARVSPTVQPKRTGQISLPTQTENLLTLEIPETQDHLNPEATKQEDRASPPDHLIVATIAASALTVQQGISLATRSAVLETLQETHLENLAELMSHVQTRESMTAIATHTAKTESQETSLAIQVLLALATRTQTAKHSLKTRF